MKRLITFIALCFVVVSTVAGISVIGLVKHHDNSEHHLSAQAQGSKPVINGEIDPSQVSDAVAYESIYNLLSTGDDAEDKDWKMRNSYLKWAGFNEIESSLLKISVYEYKRNIQDLNDEAVRLKDENWPKPSLEVMSRLSILQKKKEAILGKAIGDFRNHVYIKRNSIEKLDKFINEKVKTSIKGYVPELSQQKISWLERVLTSPFIVNAQAGGCSGYINICSQIWKDNDYVYSCGVVTSFYNSCNHSYSLSTSLNGSGYSASGSSYSTLSLTQGGIGLDGSFSTNSLATIQCFHSGWSYAIGGSGNSLTVTPWVKLGNFGSWSKSNISPQVSSEISTTYTWSQGASGEINLEFGPTTVTGISSADITISGSGNVSIPGTGSKTATFDISSTHSGSTKATVLLSKVNGNYEVLPPPTIESSAALTFNP